MRPAIQTMPLLRWQPGRGSQRLSGSRLDSAEILPRLCHHRRPVLDCFQNRSWGTMCHPNLKESMSPTDSAIYRCEIGCRLTEGFLELFQIDGARTHFLAPYQILGAAAD